MRPSPFDPDAPRVLSPMGWLHRYVRQRWRGRFLLFVEDLMPERAPYGAAAEDERCGTGDDVASTPSLEVVQQSAFRLEGPQDDELGDEPR
jgi:hypothetical protein